VGRKFGPAEQTSQRPLDLAIGALALRQQGNVTTDQLLHLGLSRAGIHHRVQIGRLYREHRSVYSVGKRARTPLERASAAVLACGPNAALSHGSAMTLWGFYRHWDAPFEVVVPGDRRRPGIVVHRCTTLARRDIKTQLGIRTTSPARTIFDMAPGLKRRTLTRVVNDALRGLLPEDTLAEIVARFPNTRAAVLLQPFVEREGGPTDSPFEDDFSGYCKKYGLPRPLTNVYVAGKRRDAWFPNERLIVELDSWLFHRDRDAFENDRERDAHALQAGIPTLRITWERIEATPDREADRLRRILEAQRARIAGPGGP
jgi:hypothetical protein